MYYRLLILFFIPVFAFSQSITIEHLPKGVNSYGADFNFIQINNNTAYYSSSTVENSTYQSLVYRTQWKDGKWRNGTYYSLGNSYATANIQFLTGEGFAYFSACEQNDVCKIAYVNIKNTRQVFFANKSVNLKNSSNTQPHIVKHLKQKVLYFVSNRPGGFGGMDIWLSIIDEKGNFGVPINAGSKINTSFDEITPFFNEDDKMLYFSSNRDGGLGGFDIYKSEGKLNLWEIPVNASDFNSEQDEMYLNFYTSSSGYFSSNRKGALYNSNEFCCNDIFSFKYEALEPDTSAEILKVSSYFPLKLYFNNDEPDCCTMSVTTEKTYKQAYISYFQKEEEYAKIDSNLILFFEDSLKGNFNKLNRILELVLKDLENGKQIQLEVKGYASPLYKKEYNINLSKRRIMSFVNYIKRYRNAALSSYLNNGKLIIVEHSLGESKASADVSDDSVDKRKSVYSLEAMQERKIEIIDVKLKE